MLNRLTFLRLALLGGLCWSSPALAEPGTSAQETGAAAANVAEPITIQRLADLRFGRFASPSTASTIQNPSATKATRRIF